MDKKHMDALLMDGKRSTVVVDSVHGSFAVHQRICDGRAIGEGWTVSHQLSGMALWTVVSKDDAVKIATWLEEQKIVPVEAEAVTAWRGSLTMTQSNDLVAKLAAIAPRYITPWRAS